MKNIEANEQTLNSYLQINGETGVLNIPFSQRPYEWEKTQVMRLFNDLVSLKDETEEMHMLNFFTLSREGNQQKIFDGQQRTITSLLILAAFAIKLNELGEEEAARTIYTEYIVKKNAFTKVEEHKIVFESEETNELFYDLINSGKKYLNYNSVNYTDISQKRLIENYKFINELIDEFIEENKINGDKLTGIVYAILNKTQLITIITATDELAMAMFESLNNTGKKLENFYVLKNDLVMILGEDIVKKGWNEIESNLASFDPSAFLQAVAIIVNGKSKKTNALEKIYASNYDKNDEGKMKELLELLKDTSEKYLYLKNPAQYPKHHQKQDWVEFKKLIEHVQLFIKAQHYPLLLAILLKESSLRPLNDVLRSLLNLGIRNFYFKEKKANTIESLLATLAKEYYDEELSISDIIKNLNKVAIIDDELKQAIISKEVSKSAEKQLKFILRETYNLVDLNKETQIKETLTGIHLEHILPQNPKEDSEWILDFPDVEEREFYTRRIGNMTLLLGKINSSISNKDFNDKVLEYRKSDIPENKEIIEKYNKWNKDSINARTEQLAIKIVRYLQTLNNTR